MDTRQTTWITINAGYLETMCVTELAIEAHEKGESEHDTINIIEFDDDYFKIKKLSRVTDLYLELKLGEEYHQKLPGDRIKTVLATSDNPGRSVKIVSRMPTMNGLVTVVDTKILQRESNILVLIQTLVILNESSGRSIRLSVTSFRLKVKLDQRLLRPRVNKILSI